MSDLDDLIRRMADRGKVMHEKDLTVHGLPKFEYVSVVLHQVFVHLREEGIEPQVIQIAMIWQFMHIAATYGLPKEVVIEQLTDTAANLKSGALDYGEFDLNRQMQGGTKYTQ